MAQTTIVHVSLDTKGTTVLGMVSLCHILYHLKTISTRVRCDCLNLKGAILSFVLFDVAVISLQFLSLKNECQF